MTTAQNRRPYRGVTPQQRDAERRARLVDAAMRLYADQRTTEVPIVVVCRAANVTTRQFYEIFGERDLLFHAVYEHSADVALRATLASIADTSLTVEQRVRAMLECLFLADEHGELGQAMRVLFVLGATSQELRKRRVSAVTTAGQALSELLGISSLFGGTIIAAVVGMLEQASLDEAFASPQETVEQLLHLFASGLST